MERFHRTVHCNKWIKQKPQTRQAVFLTQDHVHEVFFGGAAGGGKSVALLSAALQYVDHSGYNALILRRTFPQLEKPGALIDLAREWLSDTLATWNEQKHRWRFPSGATLTFGHMESEGHKYDYQGAAYHFVGFDELSQFTEGMYKYLFSRTRRRADSEVPIRIRATSNPGGEGHEWVRKRFIPDEWLRLGEDERFGRPWWKANRLFVPARLEDNPKLDIEEYTATLEELDPVTRAQLRHGDWKAHAGGRFKPQWFRKYRVEIDALVMDTGDVAFLKDVPRVILVDPANRKTKASKRTAMGVFGDLGRDRLAVLDVDCDQMGIEEIVPRLDGLCARWRPDWVGFEANGFQLALVSQARDRDKYPNIPTVHEMDPEGKSKLTRATPAIIRAEHGLIFVPGEAEWVDDFLAELCQFTGDDKEDAYTDRVDITAYAVLGLDRFGSGQPGEAMSLGRASARYNRGDAGGQAGRRHEYRGG